MSSKIPQEQKGQHMAAIGVNFAVISAAESDVQKLRDQAAPEIADVMRSFGPGPHKMPVPQPVIDPTTNKPTGETQIVDYIVNFRKDGNAYHTTAKRADQIT